MTYFNFEGSWHVLMAEWVAVQSWKLTAGQRLVLDKGCVFSINNQGISQIENDTLVKFCCIMNKYGQQEHMLLS